MAIITILLFRSLDYKIQIADLIGESDGNLVASFTQIIKPDADLLHRVF